ncbi:cyclase family protein [Streptomyces sp. NPDC005438]|uniref:cyclase family protein n=1 Tax=Streptomyces sp. NPDC005438 TaxID=3156880 RepID=UPI0033B0DEE4
MNTLTDEELRAMFQRCSNWGRWGDDDQAGTLNLITPEKRREAAGLVRSGRSGSFTRPLSKVRDEVNVRPLYHHMTTSAHNRYIGAHDWVGISCHGLANTHLDALSHSEFEGKVYNGRDWKDTWTFEGMAWCDITAQVQGIVTRGVLLDVATAHGGQWIDTEDYVTVADLERAEESAGVRVTSGDALFVHSGLRAQEAHQGAYQSVTDRAGLHAECVEWMHQRGVAVYGGDCVERMPYPSVAVPMPLHMIGCVAMGLCLLDYPEVTTLLEMCAAEERYEFLFTCAPLAIPGGTGSAANPVATF